MRIIEHVLFRHTRRDNAFKTTARVKDLYYYIWVPIAPCGYGRYGTVRTDESRKFTSLN